MWEQWGIWLNDCIPLLIKENNMLVIANESANFAVKNNRIETEWHDAGDIFEIANIDYAFECIKSGIVSMVNPVEQVQITQKIVDLPTSPEPQPTLITTPNTAPVNATQQAIDLANELGIDITNVKSKTGRITVLDVKNYQKDSVV